MKTYSPEETRLYAKSLAQKLSKGAIFALSGGLGSGKTMFAQGLADGVGVNDQVFSPTFVLMSVYEIKEGLFKHFVHVDCYRLDSPDQLLEIGLDDYLNDDDSIVVIEWAEKVRDFIPRHARWFYFSDDNNSSERTITENAS